jgi:hypothetical protein
MHNLSSISFEETIHGAKNLSDKTLKIIFLQMTSEDQLKTVSSPEKLLFSM